MTKVSQEEKEVLASPKQAESSEEESSIEESATGSGQDSTEQLARMLKAGVHFGHRKARWNPKMREYIFGLRNGIHIIDLEQTEKALEETLNFLANIAQKNGLVLIVGTKNQAKALVKQAAEKMDAPYVNNRWLGGTFTNFDFFKKRIKYLTDNKKALEEGRLRRMTKLERNKLQKKLARLEEKMGGLTKMTRLPDAIIVLDINQDRDAINEARKVGVKIIGLLDTNSDPDLVDYGIPANDDAVSSLRYILNLMVDKFVENKK